LVNDLEEVLDAGVLEECQQAGLIACDIVVDDREEAEEHVCSSQTTKADESLLTDE